MIKQLTSPHEPTGVVLERTPSENKYHYSTIIMEAIAILFVLLFVYAAISKILEYDKFVSQIGQSPLLTYFASWTPAFVIGTELLIAMMLASARWKLAGMYAAYALMLMFTAYIIAILQFSTFIPCSCGGILERLGWTEHLVFNLSFVALALAGIIIGERKRIEVTEAATTSTKTHVHE